MSSESKCDAHIQALAAYAALDLTAEQRRIVAPIVEAWREGSLALNEVMSKAQHAAVVPITVLCHARDPGSQRP